MNTARRVATGLFGAVVGLITAAIVEINFVIAFGPDQGYESTFPKIFEDNLLVGIVAVAILLAGPVVGAIVAVRQRRP